MPPNKISLLIVILPSTLSSDPILRFWRIPIPPLTTNAPSLKVFDPVLLFMLIVPLVFKLFSSVFPKTVRLVKLPNCWMELYKTVSPKVVFVNTGILSIDIIEVSLGKSILPKINVSDNISTVLNVELFTTLKSLFIIQSFSIIAQLSKYVFPETTSSLPIVALFTINKSFLTSKLLLISKLSVTYILPNKYVLSSRLCIFPDIFPWTTSSPFKAVFAFTFRLLLIFASLLILTSLSTLRFFPIIVLS